jgi:hypothetical protein
VTKSGNCAGTTAFVVSKKSSTPPLPYGFSKRCQCEYSGLPP